MKFHKKNIPVNVLLADDDKDDRFFFGKALEEIPFKTHFTTVSNGEQLMDYLSENSDQIPDVLFLDLNMPRKNGFECLEEIKLNQKINAIPIIIYSTALNNAVADILYQKGAHYYIQKSYSGLTKDLLFIFTVLEETNYKRPLREEFVINVAEV